MRKIFFKPFLKLAHTKNGHAYHRLESEPRCQQSFQIQESENRAAKREMRWEQNQGKN